MKPGYLYVLVHPSDPTLFKVGVTVLAPEKRLQQHNTQFDKYAGQIVKETGQPWQLKTHIHVPDPYWAERAFWRAVPSSVMPFRRGIEIDNMTWAEVQHGLDAAGKAGVRPPPVPRTTPVRNRDWMLQQLEGTGITMLGRYRGLVTGVEFECAMGHLFKESAGSVAYRRTCPVCAY